MTAIVVRDARSDELDAAAETMSAAYAEFFPPNPTGPWLEYREDIRDVRSRLGAAALIVAEEAGRILGAVTYYPDAGKEGHAAWPPASAVIRLLAVHPDARGRGIGRRLTEECIRRARAAGRATVGLHTTAFMAVARAMYERMGFVRLPQLDFWPSPQVRVMAYRLDL